MCWNCVNDHDSIECLTLQKLNLPKTFLIDNFDVVTPLRILVLCYRYAEQVTNSGENDIELKECIDEILCMESHCSKRNNASIWKQHATNVIAPLRNLTNINDLFEMMNAPWKLTDEFIQKICGILDVNTFEIRTQNFEVWN